MNQRVESETCDLIIDDALVVDGSGSPSFTADVAISGDRIQRIGELKSFSATERIDAQGLALSPGFIDVHTHDDLEAIRNPSMDCKISQGVTSVIAGNCGISITPVDAQASMPAPFPLLGSPKDYVFPSVAQYREEFGRASPAVNLALLVGHSSLRLNAMGEDLDRPASDGEILAMAERLRVGLDQGCIGFSSGLDYPPALRAPTEEMIALASVLRDYPRAVYTTHMRDESDGVVQSVQETLETASQAGVSVVISHHKCAGPQNYGRSVETLEMIDVAQRAQRVSLDVYPYTASSTSLLPRFIRNAEKILVAYSDPHPEFNGRDLHEIAYQLDCSLDAAAEKLYPAGAIYFQMDEQDLRRIMAFPSTMIGSDGLPSMAHPHPRLWGTFPRVLGRYVRQQGLLSLEQAVHKMTGLSAQTFNLADRGLVRQGCFADLVLFDPELVEDAATFEAPREPARGIIKVFVNGSLTWSDGARCGPRSGVFLCH